MNKVELGEEERIRALEARTNTWLRVAAVQQVLLVSLLIFAVLAVAVSIGGFADIKSLFKSIERQHGDAPHDEDEPGA